MVMNLRLHAVLVLMLAASTAGAQFSTRSRGARITPVDEGDRACTVHVLKTDYKTSESQYPCGEWFEPGPGTLLLWLEGRQRISPMEMLAVAPTPPAMNELLMTLPMVDAATIAVDPRDFPLDGSVRMVSLSHENAVFERRVTSLEQAAEGVLMPEGRQIVATFGSDGCVIALASPVTVAPGERYRFTPSSLEDEGAVFAILDQPAQDHARDAAVTLRAAGIERSPDVLKVVPRRIYAVWSSVPSGSYTIEVSGMTLDNRYAFVERGAVATIRGQMAPAESEP
jgi:hypothetical protein